MADIDEKKLKQAQTVYKLLCERLDEHKWRYKKDDSNLSIECGVQGDDLPMKFRINVKADKQIVSLLSPMPYIIDKRRPAVAVAVNQANSRMMDGNFDFDYTIGKILFRMAFSFRESIVNKQVFTYMLSIAGHTIDEYNGKFLAVSKNNMNFEEILKFVE